MISRLLTDFYQEMGDSYIVEHLEGTVEEISNRVAQGLSEIGVVYIATETAPPVPAYPVPQKAEIRSPGHAKKPVFTLVQSIPATMMKALTFRTFPLSPSSGVCGNFSQWSTI